MRYLTPKLLLITLAFFLITTTAVPTHVLAQKETEKERKKREKREKKRKKKKNKSEDTLSKQIRKYEEARDKANEKYTEDSDFKESVDYEFKRLRRTHADYAFKVNTTDTSDVVRTHSGDKIQKGKDTLYDNLLAQDYVNRVGQSLVPANSNKRYGFKVVLDPVPSARSLSTGTVYISTGLLSLVDNEAQLAYILGHEVTHVEKNHWKDDVLVAKWVEREVAKQEKKASIIGAVGGSLFGAFGGNKVSDAFSGAIIGATVSQFLFKLIDNKNFSWSLAQEDEADRFAMKYMLDRDYDVREVQTFYETIQEVASEDPRVSLDVFADKDRTDNRIKTLNGEIGKLTPDRLNKTTKGASDLKGKALGLNRNSDAVLSSVQRNQKVMSSEILSKLESGALQAGDGEFENIMATLKRDNGVIAFYYDMYKLSARNLSQALAIRSDDALGYFYYGKVLKLTARKPGEQQQALAMFTKAISLDKRGVVPHSRLYLALTKMSGRKTNNITEIVYDLKQYVTLYQRANGGDLPPNMDVVYDYMQQAGEESWNAIPVENVKQIVSTVTSRPVASEPKPKPAAKKKRRTRRRN